MCSVFGDFDDDTAGNQFVALANFFVRIHDNLGIYWCLGNVSMLPFMELESMDLQTVIAILVVAICGIFVLRSWIFFWIGLILKPDPTKVSQTGCNGCANGCQKAKNGPQLIELKREGR